MPKKNRHKFIVSLQICYNRFMTEAIMEKPQAPKLRNVGVFDIGDNAGRGLIPVLRVASEAPPQDRPKALVLIGEVSGTTPDEGGLNEAIGRCIEAGTSVFIVSKNYGSPTGIQEIKYDTQVKAAKAGAIHLRDVNVTDAVKVAEDIQRAVDQGKTGEKLNKVIIEKFGTPEEAETT